MVGDFGTPSDFQAKKTTDFGDYRLSKTLATSDYQKFSQRQRLSRRRT